MIRFLSPLRRVTLVTSVILAGLTAALTFAASTAHAQMNSGHAVINPTHTPTTMEEFTYDLQELSFMADRIGQWRPYVLLCRASDPRCAPFFSLRSQSGDVPPVFLKAMTGVSLLVEDVTAVIDSLSSAGFDKGAVPGLYALTNDGKPTGAPLLVTDAMIGDGTPSTLAHALAPFFTDTRPFQLSLLAPVPGTSDTVADFRAKFRHEILVVGHGHLAPVLLVCDTMHAASRALRRALGIASPDDTGTVVMNDRLRTALTGIYLMVADLSEWAKPSIPEGFHESAEPAFYQLTSDGKPLGSAWTGLPTKTSDVTAIAAPLDAFFARVRTSTHNK